MYNRISTDHVKKNYYSIEKCDGFMLKNTTIL